MSTHTGDWDVYEILGLLVVVRNGGILEVSSTFESQVLRMDNDTSKNECAPKHFHLTNHPTVQYFEPDKYWC